jgi:hypothetical protein
VAGNLTEEIGEPLWLERLALAQPIQSAPSPDGPVMDRMPDGSEVPVLGTFGSYLYIRAPDGRVGWVAGQKSR